LSLGLPYTVISRLGPRGRKVLILLTTFVLSLVAFVFASGEAWAQQLPQNQQQYTLVIDGVVVNSLTGTQSAKIHRPSSGSAPPLSQSESAPQSDLTAQPDTTPQPDLVSSGPSVQYATGTLLQSGSASDSAMAGGSGPASDPTFETEPTFDWEAPATSSEPAIFENKPFPAIDETSAALSSTNVSSAPLPEKPADTVPIKPPSSAANRETSALGPSTPNPGEDSHPLSSLWTAMSSVVETFQGTTANAMEALTGSFTESSSIVARSLSKDTPQPLPPPTPPTDSGSFLSLSSGGQLGSSGGSVAPLLLCCVLALGLILLPREGRLSRAFCELPKPSSALLMPLERPG
jgi:hypothetical protein